MHFLLPVKERFGQEIPEDEALQSMEEALTEYELLRNRPFAKGRVYPGNKMSGKR